MAASLPEMPCGPILELNGQRKRFHVPYGLKPLIDEMIRKVLRDQPENLYEYLACFMEARVKKMDDEEAEKNTQKNWEVHRWSWEASSVLSDEALNDFLESLRPSFEEADHYATVIQKVFRGHVAREKVKGLRKSKDSADFPNIDELYKNYGEGEMDYYDQEYEDEEEGDGEEENVEEEEETELDESEFVDEDGNVAGDEDEDYTRTFQERDSEEEFETEVETISEMDELADEMDLLTVKTPAAISKFELGQMASKIEGADFGEEEEEDYHEEEEETQ